MHPPAKMGDSQRPQILLGMEEPGPVCPLLYAQTAMKSFLAAPLCSIVAILAFCCSGAGCTREYTYSPPNRRPIPLAPVGVTSPGIGGPGGNSSDTRATGTIASGEGDPAPGVVDPASAPVDTAGVAPASGTAGVHSGGRY